jgi:hypothetical protein
VNLFLIGKKAVAIEELVNTNLDDVKPFRYNTISEFVQDTQSRGLVVDRIILMQDAYIDLEDLDFTMISLNDYLLTNYPETRFITLSNNAHNARTMAEYFLASLHIHLYFASIKPTTLLSIITDPIEEVKKKYEKIDISKSMDVVDEIIEDEDEEEEAQQGKKGGLFGLFGKKGNGGVRGKQQKRVEHTVSTASQENVVTDFTEYEDVYEDEEGESKLNPSDGYEDYEDEFEDDFATNYLDNLRVTVTPTGMDDESYVLNEGVSSEAGYDLEGEGVEDGLEEASLETTDTPYEDGEDYLDDDDYTEGSEGVEDEEPLETDSTTGWDNWSDGLDTWGTTSELEPSESYISEATDLEDTETSIDNLKELVKKHTEEGQNIIIPKVDLALKESLEATDIQDIEVELDLFDDIESMQQEYEEANVKTVVKEKVVERIVEVNKGGSNLNYREGIRLIVVTGDRKTGVTRTALNLASLYGKQDKTLYVDLDVERHGSLAYLGLESIVNQLDHIQNGLRHLKEAKSLPHLVMYHDKLGVDCLISSYDAEISEEHFKKVQTIIAHQNLFETVIVDCPLDRLHLIEDIIAYAEVLICVEPYDNTLIETVEQLSLIEDNKVVSILSRHCGFVLTKGKVDKLNNGLGYISNIFNLEDSQVNWTNLPIRGVVKDLKTIAERL